MCMSADNEGSFFFSYTKMCFKLIIMMFETIHSEALQDFRGISINMILYNILGGGPSSIISTLF